MPPFIRIGKHVINLRQVCSVVRVSDGHVNIYMSNLTDAPPAAHPSTSTPNGGLIVIHGAPANRLWRYWCETHCTWDLADKTEPSDEPQAEMVVAGIDGDAEPD
jgi:hypothetical protein